MPKRTRVLLLGLSLVTLAAISLPAGAAHNLDAHSPNLALLFSSPNGRNLTNSDMAFWGRYAYQGDYGGFRIFDISNPAAPTLVSNVSCAGNQFDINVWDRDGNGQADILFASVDQVLAGPNCGAAAASPVTDPNAWEGIRIFDISNPAAPTQIATVYQDCGSHTHTLWPDPAHNRVLLYNSSYPLRNGPTCGPGGAPRVGRDPLHGVIQVVQVSWNPASPLSGVTATEIAEPAVNYPGDPDNKFDPQEHGQPAEAPAGNPLNDLRACHDIAVYVPFRLAAAACAEQAQVWRIKPNGLPDTQKPLWVYDDQTDETGTTGNVNDTGVKVDFWHSATFTWDGSVVKFEDESFGAGCPPTTPASGRTAAFPGDTGRLFFFETFTGKKISHFLPPKPWENQYCSAHLGNFVATADRDLLVYALYMGGVTVIDVSNPAAPRELGHYDAAGGVPPSPAGPDSFDNWAAYWYEGPSLPGNNLTIYATDGVSDPSSAPPNGGARGFNVLRADIAVSETNLARLNPQTQERVIPPVTCKGNVATIIGGPIRDILRGTEGDDVIATLGGKDLVRAGRGNDTVCLGEGKDLVKGGAGKDKLFGEAGNDRLNGGIGRDFCHGGAGGDRAHKCERTRAL